MMETEPSADQTLDASGLRCPLPVIRMEAALRRLRPGAHLRVIADDPLAAIDIPHYAEAGGHRFRRLAGSESACVFLVTRGEKPWGAPSQEP